MNKLKNRMLLACFIALTLCTAQIGIMLPQSFASPTTRVSVINPITGDVNFIFYTNTTSVGYEFMVLFKVFNVTNMAAWQISLKFNPDHLTCLNASIPPDNVFAGKVILAPDPIIDNTKGILVYSATTFPLMKFNGSGNLYQAYFKIKTAPPPGQTLTSQLELVLTPPYRTFLEDYDGNEIPFTPQHGNYQYISTEPPLLAKLYIDPPRIVDATLTPCSNFTINIKIQNVIELYNFNFTLTFNPTILSATEAQPGPFLPPTTPTTIQINNTAGLIHFSATIQPPNPPQTGNGTLATITLHIKNLGQTNITLTQTNLQNQQANPIPHTTQNSYFNNRLLIGDLNGDGIVDMKDVGIMIRAFGTKKGDARWNQEADLNGDNKIDLRDVTMLMKNFGKSV